MTGRSQTRKQKSISPPSSSSSTPRHHHLSIYGQTLTLIPQTLTAKMARKSLLKPTLATILAILAFYAFFITFLSPMNPNPSKLETSLLFDSSKSFSVLNSDSSNRRGLTVNFVSVKIYVYDLPRKFTYGVIESYLMARDSLKSPVGDVSTLKYPGNQHSAEWWLFSDLIRSDRHNSPVSRVLNPEEADLFYVPFFSSLSLVVNPVRAVGFGNGGVYSDEEMQEGLIEWLEKQVYWKRNLGRDHVFICQDPNALYKVIDHVRNGVLLVSDFGRLKGDQASLVKDVILPYSHRINSYNGEVGVEGRNSLLFFMGNRYRKEGGKIRDLLFQVLENEEDVVIKHGTQSRESRRMATQGMHSSKFCLHPAGDTPSACRLFDAIVSLCIPVIVSDFIELPFEDVIDYGKIAIFVDSVTAVRPGYLISMLRGISTEKILQYQEELKAVTRYFEYEDANGTVNEIWRQVSLKIPLIKLMTHRDKRLVQRETPGLDCSCLCSNQSAAVSTRL